MRKQMKRLLAVTLTAVLMLTTSVSAFAAQTVDPATCKHKHVDNYVNSEEATCKEDGYSGDKVCEDCGKVLQKGHVIKKGKHEYFFGHLAKPSTTKQKGLIIENCMHCGRGRNYVTDKLGSKGKSYKRVTIQGNTYEIYQENDKWGLSIPIATLIKAKKASAVTVPEGIKYKGEEYAVAGISSKAFNNDKKIKKVIIGEYVASIGSKAFNKCPNLKTITIKSNELAYTMNKKVYYMAGKNSFKGINKKAVIKVPKKMKKTYKKAFKGMKVK